MTSTCPEGHGSEADDYCDVCGAPIDAATSAGTGPAGSVGPAGSTGSAGSAGSDPDTASGSDGLPSASMLDLGSSPLSGAGPQAPAGAMDCPNCAAVNVPGALFCESCGYDFTTGQLPRTDPPPSLPPPLPAPLPPLPAQGGAPDLVSPMHPGPAEWVAEVWIDPDWHAVQEVSEPCPSPGMPEVVPLRGVSQLVGRRSVSRNIHPQIDCGADTGVSRRHAQLTTDGQRWWVEDLQSSNGTYVGTTGEALPEVPVPPGQRAELPDDARVYLGAWTRIVVRPATAQERNTVV